ncbi:MAG TPA: hypothetical protein DEG17_19470 [Cyanobacteria bacterium UBA11149]|nr:hypothetical protein [Cyanobacteria bacterium UBA11367]HBE57813.1 hypothetical protein [Cyanobacteria bacterium UBA11366]HBK62506.1 hypothetical protein [Cyanobacteria bacterium UBA11166]HBR72796.1 hypothetical protein [Cyanobacteria bacterium UBA11159]HBS71668.1 hypothetical protein [Cyanobacteria bacterium UBA11153]HBW90982.1 hypothetical protein [Cyanobacteria bacterium UBA11149]HCA95507.1 hypothetical protein [Cyanobacteria bacterium UBA9226]
MLVICSWLLVVGYLFLVVSCWLLITFKNNQPLPSPFSLLPSPFSLLPAWASAVPLPIRELLKILLR